MREKTPEKKLKTLLCHIPLLRSNNPNIEHKFKLKNAYHELINDLLDFCYKTNSNMADCYRLCLLITLHPIFDPTEQSAFKKWSEAFEMRLNVQNRQLYHGTSADSDYFEDYSSLLASKKFAYLFFSFFFSSLMWPKLI